jgi:hypothetical protein
MPRPRGNGIKIVRKKLADGSVREYRYVKPEPARSRAIPATMAELCEAYRDGRLRRNSVSPSISGASAGGHCSVPLSGRHAGRA